MGFITPQMKACYFQKNGGTGRGVLRPLTFKLQLFGSKNKNCPPGFSPNPNLVPEELTSTSTGSQGATNAWFFRRIIFLYPAFFGEESKQPGRFLVTRFFNNQYFIDSFRDPGSDVRHWTQKFHVTKPLDVKKWTTHRGGWILHDFSRGNQPTVPVGGVCYSRFTALWSWRPLPSGFGSEIFHGLEVVKKCRRFGVFLPESLSLYDWFCLGFPEGGGVVFFWWRNSIINEAHKAKVNNNVSGTWFNEVYQKASKG